eukprot:scaffold7011_cov112-Isochrysis_galbana.AAC.19
MRCLRRRDATAHRRGRPLVRQAVAGSWNIEAAGPPELDEALLRSIADEAQPRGVPRLTRPPAAEDAAAPAVHHPP